MCDILLYPLILICWFYFSPWLWDVKQKVLSLMISVLVRYYWSAFFFSFCLLREDILSHECRLVVSSSLTPPYWWSSGFNFLDLLSTLVCGVFSFIHDIRIWLPPFDSCHLSIKYQISPCVLLFADWANHVADYRGSFISSIARIGIAVVLAVCRGERLNLFFFRGDAVHYVKTPFKKPISKLFPNNVDFFIPSIYCWCPVQIRKQLKNTNFYKLSASIYS